MIDNRAHLEAIYEAHQRACERAREEYLRKLELTMRELSDELDAQLKELESAYETKLIAFFNGGDGDD